MRLRLRIQPRASRTELAGLHGDALHGDALRVRVAAPPVDGAANDALVRFLAERLGVGRAAVTIVSGHAGRDKVVVVSGIAVAEALNRLA